MTNRAVPIAGPWELAHFDGYGQTIGERALPAALASAVWIPARVPGSVYADLTAAGWLGDVRVACNSLAARWVEHEYWFYRVRFDGDPAPGESFRTLVCDGLDLDAGVFLNGDFLGEHHNAFRPARFDLTGRLRERGNELILRVNSGLLAAADRRGGDYNLETTAVATKRAWLRKPHFGCRWDWAPRLMGVGIGGGVALERSSVARIDQVVVTCEVAPDGKRAVVRLRACVENPTQQHQALRLICNLRGTEAHAEVSGNVAPGPGELRAELPVRDPRLWWPRPWGEAALYTLDVRLLAGDALVQERCIETGLRSVELRRSPASDGGERLHLVVNGRPVFCKGANWVPADLLWPLVGADDYARLVALAVEGGYNLLRIWGGGLYADEALLAECDRAGILVWHDLMFACSKFPADDPAFAAEVEREVRFQVRRLSPHPSLVVWCGNNEVDVGIADGWLSSYDPASRPCDAMFHERLAEALRVEDPSRPYWPSSPYSPDGSHPNNRLVGDQHPWDVSLGPPKGDYWHYRQDASRFPNEGGMLGPSTPATLRQILPVPERFVGSRTWLHHDNSQNTWKGEPLLDNLLRVNLCDEPRALPFDDYVRFAGVLHGEALETAIDNWRRRKWDSAAAVFWMFNDCWPAVTSWTPIDYCRRRKPAFWYVKRAFADLRAICVALDEDLAVVVVNDTLEPQRLTLRYGLFAMSGGRPLDETIGVDCPANDATIAARFPLSDWDRFGVRSHGAFAALSAEDGRTLSTQRLFRARFRELEWSPASVHATAAAGEIVFHSDAFAWAVSVDEEGERPLADNWFDLIPGIAHRVPWPADGPQPAARPSNPSGTMRGAR